MQSADKGKLIGRSGGRNPSAIEQPCSSRGNRLTYTMKHRSVHKSFSSCSRKLRDFHELSFHGTSSVNNVAAQRPSGVPKDPISDSRLSISPGKDNFDRVKLFSIPHESK